MKFIICGHFSLGANSYAIPGKREPSWLVFDSEQEARKAIKNHSIELIAVYKAEELPLEKETRKLVTETLVLNTVWAEDKEGL